MRPPRSPDRPDRRSRGGRRGGERDPREEQWRAGDILALVVAALQVVLPFVGVILAAVVATWGLWILWFR